MHWSVRECIEIITLTDELDIPSNKNPSIAKQTMAGSFNELNVEFVRVFTR